MAPHHNPVEQVLVDVLYLVSRQRLSIGEALDHNTYAAKDSAEYNRALAYIVSSFNEGDSAYTVVTNAIDAARKDGA